VTGFIGTVLILGSLQFNRSQMTTFQADVEQVSQLRIEPLAKITETQTRYRLAQEAFVRGTKEPTTQLAGAAFAEALVHSAEAAQAWDQFKAEPVQFEGEQQTRDAVDAAIKGDDEAGQRLGVAVLTTANPDPVLVAQLTAEQQVQYDQLQAALEHLEMEFFWPALSQDVAGLNSQAQDTNRLLLIGLGAVAALGALITVVAHRRAARFERADERARRHQQQASAENELDARLQQALDMAESEPRVHRVLDRALGPPPHSCDVLIAGSSASSFDHVLATSDTATRCPVASPAECPVTRHGQELVTTDSQALDACS